MQHPEIVTVVLQTSSRKDLFCPCTGQRVRVDGRDGTFIVVRSDPKRRIADLMLLTGLSAIVEDVPFANIHILRHAQQRGASQAARTA